VIIAQTILYRKQRGIARRIRIAIAAPEREPLRGREIRCRVSITGEKARYAFGSDSFQALNLAFVYIRSVASAWLRRRQVLYFDRQLKYRYDVQFLILNDASFYEKLGLAMQKRGKHV